MRGCSSNKPSMQSPSAKKPCSQGGAPHLGLHLGPEAAQSWGSLRACPCPQLTHPSAVPQLPLCSRPLARGFYPRQGQAETPACPQAVPAREEVSGAHGRQAQAQAEGRELLPAHEHGRSCWQGCPARAHGSRALCQHCQPTGTGTCGVLAAHPVHIQGIPGERLLLSQCLPPLCNWGASPGLCPQLRAGPAPSSASRQSPQGFWLHDRHRAVPPARNTASPCAPPAQCQSKPSWHRGQGLRVPRLGVRVGAGAGLL